MAPRPISNQLQSDEERSDSFPLTWITAIIFNVLFIICLFVALIYCIKKRNQKKPDQMEETKPSPIFRKRTISQSFQAANFQFSTPSSANSFRTSSSSSKKSRKSNRISSVDMVQKVQTKDQIESKRPMSPVRYDSPPGPKALSSVFTIQKEGSKILENGQAKINGEIHSIGQSNDQLLEISVRKPSLSFKNLATVQTRLKSEMNDSRVKLKALDFDKQSNDHSEDNSKQTINNDIESLDSTEVINDENDSIQSLSMSGDEQQPNGDKKKTSREKKIDQNDQEKDELIEQLSKQMIKEQAKEILLPNGLNNHNKLNNSETELTFVSDSGIGDSQANLSNVTQFANLPTNQHKLTSQQAAKSVLATAANASTSILVANNNQQFKSSTINPINKQLTRLDSFTNKATISTPPAKDSPSIQMGSIKEFSFSQSIKPEKQNFSENFKQNESAALDKQLHELQSNSKVISRHDSKKSRNGSGKRKRMKSAGVQTTPSLRRSTPQPRLTQNKESVFSNVYTDIASKLDPTEQAEQLANMKPIEEENFFYSPDSEHQERKYFIYLISDTSNPFYKKDCIGKILLPARGQLTLSELRDQLFKQSEDSVKTILKKGKNFRFLTETYRFVSQNESIASVKEVYPTQGIFLKLNSSDNPVSYNRSKATGAKNDLTNIINAAFHATESQAGGMTTGTNRGTNQNPGNQGGKGQRQIHIKAPSNRGDYTKDLGNLNREAAAIGDNIPRVHVSSVSKGENENSQIFSPAPQFLSSFNNTPSVRTVSPDQQRSADIREALFRRHGRCLYPQPIIRKALPKQVVVKGELSKQCNLSTCPLISIMKCSKCGRAYYCSYEHKREHWPEHRIQCQRPPWRL